MAASTALLAALPPESTLQAAHQRPRRALHNVGFESAVIEPLHPRVEVGAGADQPLSRGRKRGKNRRVGILGMAKPAFRATPFTAGDLTGLDRALGQKPGDDVHDPRRHLERFASEADTREGFERRTLVAPRVVEVGASLVG